MKNKGILFALLISFLISGCENIIKEKSDNNKVIESGSSIKEEDKTKCSIINFLGNYGINESLICPKFKEISSSGHGFFITESGELYEYSDKKYSTTNNNCKKVETNVLFTNIVENTLVGKDGNYYSFHEKKLRKIPDDEIQKGRAWYGLDQMEIRLHKLNNKIFYLDQLDMNDPDIYGYVDGNNIYEISYNHQNNKSNEKLLLTLKDGEKVEKTTNGYVITNKGYYRYGMTNQKECSEYADIKCEYGLVLIDTIDNCANEIYYLSNGLIVTKNMIK